MFGLRKCSEEDFHQFVYSNSRYHPDDIDGYLLGVLIGIFVFLGIGYFYIGQSKMKYPDLINIVIKIFIIVNVLTFILSTINQRKYAFRFQKSMLIVLLINWFVLSIIIYQIPLIVAYYKNWSDLFNSTLCAIMVGFVYLMHIFVKLINLIKKGEMRKGCAGIYQRILNKKILYFGMVSVPIIVIASKLARRLTITMNNSGFNMGPVILMLVLGFIMQIGLSIAIPEIAILTYCKFRFKSFNVPYKVYSSKGKNRKNRKINKK